MSNRPQAISGVSTGENQIMTVFPSICSGGIGKLLGSLYDSIPIPVFGPKLSRLLFCLPTAPIGLLLYGLSKATGNKYVLTNNSVEIWSVVGKRRGQTVALKDVAGYQTDEKNGQAFFDAADLELLSESGETLLTLPGLPRAEVFGETIMKAQQAKSTVASSLATIEARQSA
ncbi:MAG: hypothetical protein AB8G99_26925 [Planctomycetaceae bacterium]